jgi:lipoprotein signal peptidase
MKKWRRFLLVFLVISACVGCDQTTKAFARWHLPKSGVLSLGGDTLRLQYAENKGGVLAFEM